MEETWPSWSGFGEFFFQPEDNLVFVTILNYKFGDVMTPT